MIDGFRSMGHRKGLCFLIADDRELDSITNIGLCFKVHHQALLRLNHDVIDRRDDVSANRDDIGTKMHTASKAME